MWKFLRNTVFYSIIVLSIALGGAVYYANTHEEEIKAYALAAIQEHLISDVDVKSIELSLLQHFPAAALSCENVLIYDTFEERDTLIFAQELALEFNLIELLQGKYEVQGVSINEALVKLQRLEDGAVNYTFWKTDAEADSSNFTFALEGAQFNNTRLLLNDTPADLKLDLQFDALGADGTFQDEALRLDFDIDAPMAWIEVDGTAWLNRVPIEGVMDLEVLLETDKYIVHSSSLDVNENSIEGKGSFQNTEDHVLCAFTAQGNRLKLSKVLASLPPRVQSSLSPYKISGEADLTCEISGAAGGNEKPLVSIAGGVRKGIFEHKEKKIELENIASAFQYTFDEKERLELQSLSATLNGGQWSLKGALENLSDPWINLTLNGASEAKDLSDFLGLKEVQAKGGELVINAHISGKLPAWKYSESLTKVNGEVSIRDLDLILGQDRNPYEHLQGKVKMEEGVVDIAGLSGQYRDTDFLIEAEVKHLLEYIGDDGELVVDARLLSQNINLNNWIDGGDEGTPEGTADESTFELPKSLQAKLSLKANHFQWRQAQATELVSTWTYQPGQVSCNQLTAFLADGQIESSGTLRSSSSKHSYVGKAQIQNVDLEALFRDFENFDQKTILAENVHGRCDVSSNFSLFFDRQWNFLENDLLVEADVSMREGELIALSSLMEVPGYLRENKVVAPFVDIDALEKELQHIYFSTISNHISIGNGAITIPKMDIPSSAMNLSVAGVHHFDQTIDYSLGFYLRDLLVDKSSTEYGKVEDDGLGNRFFLSMGGSTENPEFSYDRLAHKQQRQEDFQQEKQTLKEIIKEDLNPFKKKEENGNPKNRKVSEGEDDDGVTIQVKSEAEEGDEDNGGLRSLFKGKKGKTKKTDSEKKENLIDEDDDF